MLQYRAVALQLKCYPINRAVGVTESRQIINANLARLDPALDGLRIMTGEDVKLVVLPEYLFTGFPLGISVSEWAKRAAFDPQGAEYQALAQMAAKNGI